MSRSKVSYNVDRLLHLITLYGMSEDEALDIVNQNRKTEVTGDELFGKETSLSNLKKLDNIFKRGLSYYFDPSPPVKSEEASIFFRKESFGAEPNLGARMVVNEFERKKILLSSVANLSGVAYRRILKKYSIKDDPMAVGFEVRSSVLGAYYPTEKTKTRDYFKRIVQKLAVLDVYVFEFIENNRTKYKANIDGFFLEPNVIVVKKKSTADSRELLSLAHELGHYLLGLEEVENVDESILSPNELSSVERWCYDFAFYFLIGDSYDEYSKIYVEDAGDSDTKNLIKKLSKQTKISQKALFTGLLFRGRISQSDYKAISDELDHWFQYNQQEEQKKRDLEKEMGIDQQFRSPKPIKSNLLIEIVQLGYYNGILSPSDVARELGIKPTEIHKFIDE